MMDIASYVQSKVILGSSDTMAIIIDSWFFSLFCLLCKLKSSNEISTDLRLFLVSPGDGREFVYSPVGVNTTLHCAVNSTILGWVVYINSTDTLTFGNPAQKPVLDSRGIFQSGLTTSADVTASTVTVVGNRELNNHTQICCQSFMFGLKQKCVILIIYGNNTFIEIIDLFYCLFMHS